MLATLDRMGKKKASQDRHKPRRMVGLSERICAQFDKMAKDREASLAEMVKVACIDYLTRAGLWPPPSK